MNITCPTCGETKFIDKRIGSFEKRKCACNRKEERK